jgi:hypothetical protein
LLLQYKLQQGTLRIHCGAQLRKLCRKRALGLHKLVLRLVLLAGPFRGRRVQLLVVSMRAGPQAREKR